MEQTEYKRVSIRSYNKVWKIENRIYSIYNLVLPVSVSWREIGYFAAVFAIVFILSAIIPVIAFIPGIIRLIVFPVVITQFMLKKKLDGKMPQKYLISWVGYVCSKSNYIERFQTHSKNENETIKLDWFCSRGNASSRSAQGRRKKGV